MILHIPMEQKAKLLFTALLLNKLNQNFLPIIKEWYQKNRPQKEAEIFCYYTDNKNYKLPKENLAIFLWGFLSKRIVNFCLCSRCNRLRSFLVLRILAFLRGHFFQN